MAKLFKNTTARTEYFDSCIDNHYNGNLSDCRKMFATLSKYDKKEFIMYIFNLETLPKDKSNLFNFFFTLL